MIEHHRHYFNEIMAKREAQRKLAAQQRRDAAWATFIALCMGAALFVLVALAVAMISTPR